MKEIEGLSPKEPTRAQLSAANVLFALTLDELCKKKAKEELGLEDTYRKRDYFKVRRIANPLMELYILRYNNIPLDKFEEKWKEEAGTFTKLLDEITPDIEKERVRILAGAADISEYERTEITKKALRRMLGEHHRDAIVSMEGSSEEQRRDQRGKYKKSAGWSLGTTLLSIPVIGAAVTAVAANQIVDLEDITDWRTFLTVAGLWLARNGSIRLAANAHTKALDNPDINTSVSIGATAAHDTATNVIPENAKLKKRAIFYATGFPSFAQDALYSPGIILGPALYAGRLAGETIFYTGEAAATEAYLLYRKAKTNMRRRRMEKMQKQQTPPSTS